MIIAVYGEMGHGKDEAGKQLASYFKKQGFYVVNQRFAMRLKQFASVCFNIPLTIVDQDSYSEPVWDFTTEQKNIIIPHYTDCVDISKQATPMTLGRFLQLFATEVVRDSWHKDFWANCTLDYIKEEHKHHINIITDLRFPNELRLLKNERAVTVRILRPGEVNVGSETGRDINHSSEVSFKGETFLFNHNITNDSSLEEFQIKCQDLAAEILQEDLLKR